MTDIQQPCPTNEESSIKKNENSSSLRSASNRISATHILHELVGSIGSFESDLDEDDFYYSDEEYYFSSDEEEEDAVCYILVFV
jgi:hypothetical protein